MPYKLKIGIAGEVSKNELLKLRQVILGRFPLIKKKFPIGEIYLFLVSKKIRDDSTALKFIEENTPPDSRTILLVRVPDWGTRPLLITNTGVHEIAERAVYHKGCFVIFKEYKDITYLVIAHGLGHAFGIEHCNNVNCVMYHSSTSNNFCPSCKKQLARFK